MINRKMMIMHSTAYLDKARSWARLLENREATRSGRTVSDARQAVARKVGIASGTLETLRCGRLKAVTVYVYERLRSAVAADLAAEIQRLEHELELTRQAGVDPRSVEIGEVETHLAAAREALFGKVTK